MTTVATALWWDGNSVTCVEHMGATLSAEVKAHPRKKSHITRFGEAYLMAQDEINEIQAIMGDRHLCESCDYEAQ